MMAELLLQPELPLAFETQVLAVGVKEHEGVECTEALKLQVWSTAQQHQCHLEVC
jgi:hypothetical protein